METLKNSGNGNGNGNPKIILIFRELCGSNIEKFLIFSQKKGTLIFRETELSSISGNETFLYFGKGIFRTLTYLELEVYSEPCYI